MSDVKHFDPEAALETVLQLFWRRGTASTGVQDIVEATGLNRSSLYNAFGAKQALYAAALERYVDQRSAPVFEQLAGDGRGLAAVREFFDGLIDARCSGEYARWGCMVSNAYAGLEQDVPGVRAVLQRHHRLLRDSLDSALVAAQQQGQLTVGLDPGACADHLVLVAYGVNLRSRNGAPADELRRGVDAALAAVAAVAT